MPKETLVRWYRAQIGLHLNEFRRYRALRRNEEASTPFQTNPEILRTYAKDAGILEPPPGLSDQEIVAWHYWIEVVQIARLQAWLLHEGEPIVATSPDDKDDLASVNSAIADLIRGLLEGHILEEFALATQRRRQPTAPARRRDALHKIASVASLAAEGHIPDLTSREVLERAGERLGLTWEGVRKAARRAGPNRLLDPTRTMVLHMPSEERTRWANEEIAESVQEYREWDTPRNELSH